MLTVSISINGNPILTRTATNRINEVGAYVRDDGALIRHNPDDGAIVLAIKTLLAVDESLDAVIRTLDTELKKHA